MSCENHETVSNITICTNLEARILMRIESARLEPKSQSNLDSILGTLKESKRPMGLSEKKGTPSFDASSCWCIVMGIGELSINNY